MPASPQASAAGLEIGAGGEITVGPQFRALEAAWLEGVAAIARAGARVTGMAASQAELVHQGVAHDLEVDTTHTEAWPPVHPRRGR